MLMQFLHKICSNIFRAKIEVKHGGLRCVILRGNYVTCKHDKQRRETETDVTKAFMPAMFVFSR